MLQDDFICKLSDLIHVKFVLCAGYLIVQSECMQVPTDFGDRILLHFGAVDWQATVYVDRTNVGTHRYETLNYILSSGPLIAWNRFCQASDAWTVISAERV